MRLILEVLRSTNRVATALSGRQESWFCIINQIQQHTERWAGYVASWYNLLIKCSNNCSPAECVCSKQHVTCYHVLTVNHVCILSHNNKMLSHNYENVVLLFNSSILLLDNIKLDNKHTFSTTIFFKFITLKPPCNRFWSGVFYCVWPCVLDVVFSCAEDLPLAVLLLFCSEGDNIPDAFTLVNHLNNWLHLLENPVRQPYIQLGYRKKTCRDFKLV